MGKIKIRTGRGTGTMEVDSDPSNGLVTNLKKFKQQEKLSLLVEQ